MSEQERYLLAVNQALVSLFEKDNENHQFDLNKIDATQFFIGLIKGCGMFYNKLTNDDKNFLEFTYLCNQLIVQDLLKEDN